MVLTLRKWCCQSADCVKPILKTSGAQLSSGIILSLSHQKKMIILANETDDFDSKLELGDEGDTETVHNLDLNLTEPQPRHKIGPSCSEDAKAVNFVHRHIYFDSICASYVINPGYQDPLRGSSSKGKQRRKNLFLRSECGHIDVDVRVLHTEAGTGQSPRKVALDFQTTFGSIHVKVHASSSPDRLPIHIYASSNCGPLNKISLPQSFQGFLVLSLSLGQLSLSPKIKEKISWESQAGKTRTIFIGDLSVLRSRSVSGLKNNIGPWAGDKVHLDAVCGSVTIDFVEETGSSFP
ncbi:hypothetical protein D9757_007113 [Collybiopsis confluens]|uniref:DUF7330 domain-containing protein n=1 Tax=Collybiopsis confluens TaxID=2823264 RepID=A0A8H5HCR3_9AGAR|nr:hypothetical protein D9757_007113 [Collybiopsis confluens]